MNKIGIGITTQDRQDVFEKCYAEIVKYMPPGAKLVVVDDASKLPVTQADYRFDEVAGIAKAKNKCFELLDDCDHIFLFDSDCWPNVGGWWKPYVESEEPHLCYIFKHFINKPLNDCHEVYRDQSIVAYTHARGCMLYFKKVCLETIGGMDTRHKRWGREHIDISTRIFNAGLTTFKFMDVPDSSALIHSEDEHQAVSSTVGRAERQKYLMETRELAIQSATSREYCEYREVPVVSNAYSDLVLTVYLTGVPDPQRNTQWTPNIHDVEALINSIDGERLIILNDCFEPEISGTVESVRVESQFNPYHQRWFNIYKYLRAHPEIDRVFCVDATDVEMLNNPFEHELDMNKLYVGDEVARVNIPWMHKHAKNVAIKSFLYQYGGKPLLNCGVVGGSRELVMKLAHDMFNTYFTLPSPEPMDMTIFNYLCYTKYSDRIIHGRTVTTIFKADERKSNAFWKHK